MAEQREPGSELLPYIYIHIPEQGRPVGKGVHVQLPNKDTQLDRQGSGRSLLDEVDAVLKDPTVSIVVRRTNG